MDDKKDLINLDETRQSLESTQKTATDIGERVKEVAYMSDKVNHDRMITEILNDKKLSTAEKMKQYDHEQKLYQRRQKANAKVNGQTLLLPPPSPPCLCLSPQSFFLQK